MGVDEVDLVAGHVVAVQRELHRPPGAVALLDRLDEVPRVAGGAEADDLGVDARAARLGHLQVLEHHRARALTQHEAVAALVERP